MATMTMRLDDVDVDIVRIYAQFGGKSVSGFIPDAVLVVEAFSIGHRSSICK